MDTSRHEFTNWPLDLLIDYALKMHHGGIRKNGPVLLQLIQKVKNESGIMPEIERQFSQSLDALDSHLQKEENVLFPYLYDLIASELGGTTLEPIHCGSIANPIRVMVMEHSEETERYEKLRVLTNDFTSPSDATEDYRRVVNGLREFSLDLCEHVHIENDIIFPKCQLIEQQCFNSTSLYYSL